MTHQPQPVLSASEILKLDPQLGNGSDDMLRGGPLSAVPINMILIFHIHHLRSNTFDITPEWQPYNQSYLSNSSCPSLLKCFILHQDCCLRKCWRTMVGCYGSSLHCLAYKGYSLGVGLPLAMSHPTNLPCVPYVRLTLFYPTQVAFLSAHMERAHDYSIKKASLTASWLLASGCCMRNNYWIILFWCPHCWCPPDSEELWRCNSFFLPKALGCCVSLPNPVAP